MEHFQSWSDLVNPEFYIKLGGYWLVLFIIFAETGLFVGFFLPGDSLLFISGIYAVPMVRDTFGITGSDLLDTTIIASSISLAAIIGNMVSYWFGRRSGMDCMSVRIRSSSSANTYSKHMYSMKNTEL